METKRRDVGESEDGTEKDDSRALGLYTYNMYIKPYIIAPCAEKLIESLTDRMRKREFKPII